MSNSLYNNIYAFWLRQQYCQKYRNKGLKLLRYIILTAPESIKTDRRILAFMLIILCYSGAHITRKFWDQVIGVFCD